MAQTEVYVDISIGGGDAGNGTIGNPYNSLRYAFAQEGNPSNYTRYNVKGTTYASPSNDNGTLPAPSHRTRRIIIQPYSSSEGDSRGPIYISGTGHKIFNQNSVDYISFVDCHFFDYGTSFAFTLDNYIDAIRCTFDPSGLAPSADFDADSLFHNCHFKKITGKQTPESTAVWDFNTIDWIADATNGFNDFILTGQVFFQNRIFCSGSVDEVISPSFSRGCLANSNSIKMTRGNQDDTGMLLQTQSFAEFNHIEGAHRPLYNYGRGAYIQNNSLFDISADDVTVRSTAISTVPSGTSGVDATNTITLAEEALPGVSFTPSGDSALSFIPTTELMNLHNQSTKNQDLPGSGNGHYDHTFGAVFVTPSGQLPYTRNMRIIN